MESVEQKKVPLSWTISNLKNFFAKVHKIPVNVYTLIIFSYKNYKYNLMINLQYKKSHKIIKILDSIMLRMVAQLLLAEEYEFESKLVKKIRK